VPGVGAAVPGVGAAVPGVGAAVPGVGAAVLGVGAAVRGVGVAAPGVPAVPGVWDAGACPGLAVPLCPELPAEPRLPAAPPDCPISGVTRAATSNVAEVWLLELLCADEEPVCGVPLGAVSWARTQHAASINTPKIASFAFMPQRPPRRNVSLP
jgi:hypothetical protein